MSKETIEWLNQNTLIGYTDDRDKWAGNGFVIGGKPWWQVDGFTGGFPGPIPIDAILDRLFFWEPLEGDLTVRIPVDDVEFADGVDDQGNPYKNMVVPDKKAIIRPDTETVLGVFSDGYRVHSNEAWLIDAVTTILDQSHDEIGVGSAGMLKGGAQAYVSFELPETITTASGFALRSNIIAMTSCDGSLATTYKAGTHAPVCDNSLSLFVAGVDNRVKIKHSSKSLKRVGEVRDALGILYDNSAAMVEFLDRCAETAVTHDQFQAIVATLVPKPDPVMSGGKVTNQRSITNAENRTDELWHLWRNDARVGNLSGTLHGAHQAVNTWNEHLRTRNDNGVERVMAATLDGTVDKDDAQFWAIVAQVGVKVPEMVVNG